MENDSNTKEILGLLVLVILFCVMSATKSATKLIKKGK